MSLLVQKPQFNESELRRGSAVRIEKTNSYGRHFDSRNGTFVSGDCALVVKVEPLRITMILWDGSHVSFKVEEVSDGDVRILQLEEKEYSNVKSSL